jgi:hypothetical protein
MGDAITSLLHFDQDSDIAQIERLASGFNLFEMIGATRNELRHSTLLSNLMDPNASHGLGDAFLRRFLDAASAGFAGVGESNHARLLKHFTTSDVVVRREFGHIDICLSSQISNMVIIVENKIGTSEHSNQLSRYLEFINARFPGYGRMGVYLTPDGTFASDATYAPVSYSSVADAVNSIVIEQGAGHDPSVVLVLSHYERMLRRHVVSDSELAQLCREIYQRHKAAIDLINQHRPTITQTLLDIVQTDASVVFKGAPKNGRHIQFTVSQWDTEYLFTNKWRPSNRVLLFQINNDVDMGNALRLVLLIGPGNEHLRTRITERAASAGRPFTIRNESHAFTQLYEYELLTEQEVKGTDTEALEEALREKWDRFIHSELPGIVLALNISPSMLHDGSQSPAT